jgi:sugar-specific transcriptional regulator TrmB
MPEMIARVRKEMQERLREIESELASVEALISEKARLERALATPPFAVEPPAQAAASAKRRRPARPRAPRGANQAAVRTALETMPGATVAEVAAASGVGRAQVYALLRAGVEKGEFKQVELAAGQLGYRIAVEPETAFPEPEPVSLTRAA